MLGGAPEGWKRTARGQFEHHADATAVMAPPAGEAIGGFVSSVPATGKAPISAETRPHAVLVNRLGGCQGRRAISTRCRRNSSQLRCCSCSVDRSRFPGWVWVSSRLLPSWLGVFAELMVEDHGVVVWLDGFA